MIGTDDGRSSNFQKVTQLSIREFKKALHDVEPMTTWESSSVRHIDSSKKITSEKSKNPNDVIQEKFGDSEKNKNLSSKIGVFLSNAGDRDGGRRKRAGFAANRPT
ncbi:hypothetical protein RN001_010143 [Aquatica leii]|uniref:Uncharacterized protein n=1 Tax=Aquatica leii TaxID=1421715 RepID=A0AAN7SE99_9COLE|nr:hypothetical protein RN001_010143 [Aquatica leii]